MLLIVQAILLGYRLTTLLYAVSALRISARQINNDARNIEPVGLPQTFVCGGWCQPREMSPRSSETAVRVQRVTTN